MKRSLYAMTLAALLVPAAVSAQARRGTAAKPATSGAYRPLSLTFGGFVGYEAGDFDGFSLRVDGEMPFQRTPQLTFSGVGSIGLTRISKELGTLYGYDLGSFTTTIIKFVPAARFTLPINPQFSVYGDAGLGLYHASSTYYATEVSVIGYGPPPYYDPVYGWTKVKLTGSTTGLMARLGAGGFFQVNPQVKLGAELALNPYFGDIYTGSTTTFSFMVGAMFATR